jgi:UDP-N-acetylmuramate dehydrogenase
VQTGAPLGLLSTFKAGGAADVLVETSSATEPVAVIDAARQAGVPLTIIGGGSNLLISDRGVRGVVVRQRGGIIGSPAPNRVRADAAVTINGLVRWTIGRGLAGLEAWAGTPGTVGGAVHGNAHWKGVNIGDVIESVRLVQPDGTVHEVPADRVGFAYDTSRLQATHEVVLSVLFRVRPGADPSALRAVARASLAYRKQTQPLAQPSAGCVFRNPDPERDPVPEGIPPSAGALIDRAGLKGRRLGGAAVSAVHANFIVNEGGATASEIAALADLCRDTVRERFGVLLREEIVRLGDWDGHEHPPSSG